MRKIQMFARKTTRKRHKQACANEKCRSCCTDVCIYGLMCMYICMFACPHVAFGLKIWKCVTITGPMCRKYRSVLMYHIHMYVSVSLECDGI